jgi:nitroreductase
MKQTITKLPIPRLKGDISLEETILRRRAVRRYRREPLLLTQLSQILWSAQGTTGTGKLRAAPSAGATYPLEIFVVVGDQCVIVSEANRNPGELQAGIYHYDSKPHSLRLTHVRRFKTRFSDGSSE